MSTAILPASNEVAVARHAKRFYAPSWIARTLDVLSFLNVEKAIFLLAVVFFSVMMRDCCALEMITVSSGGQVHGDLNDDY